MPDSAGTCPRCWINTVSREHVWSGIEGGFAQADHGRAARLRNLSRGDWIAFYSSRTQMRGGEPVQCFTAPGTIVDDVPYQVEMAADFHPWRRNVAFVESREASVRPLLKDLDFILDEARWGWPFRRGLFEVSYEDMERITGATEAALRRPSASG